MRISFTVLTISIVCFAAVRSDATDFAFAHLPEVDATLAASELVSGDFDGDGDPDVALRANNMADVEVFWNDGGELSAPELLTFPFVVGDLAAGDFAAGGGDELAVALASGETWILELTRPGSLLVVSVDAAGRLLAADVSPGGAEELLLVQREFPSQNELQVWSVTAGAPAVLLDLHEFSGLARELVAVDLNNDAFPDVVVTDSTGDELHVFPGVGGGTFVEITPIPVDDPTGIAVGDLDQDGAPDLVVGSGIQAAVFLNDGLGGLEGAFAWQQYGTTNLELADLDGDGLLDLVAGGYARGMGGGAFGVARPFTHLDRLEGVSGAFDALAIDLDSNGTLELVVSRRERISTHDYDPRLVTVPGGAAVWQLDTPAYRTTPDFVNRFADAEAWDLEGDGVPELIAMDATRLTVLDSDSEGALSIRDLITIEYGSNSFATGDFDNDGIRDIFAATNSGPSTILFGDGVGGFLPPMLSPVGMRKVIAAEDYDLDGNLDLFAVSSNHEELMVFVGDGLGGFTFEAQFDFSWSGDVHSAFARDVDLDGDADLLVGTSSITWLIVNLGGGVYAPPVDLGPYGANDLAMRDLDQDGLEDLVFVDSASIKILAGEPGGTFSVAAELSLPFFNQGGGLALADYDADGDLDYCVRGYWGRSVVFASGLADGTGFFAGAPFILGGNHGVGGDPDFFRSFLAEDFTGDGRIDLASVDASGAIVIVNEFEASSFIRGDSNLDGTVDVTDAIALLTYLFGPVSTPLLCEDAGDTDDSGALDLADAIGLLAYLFGTGTPPELPFPDCGEDSTPDTLGKCVTPAGICP